MSACSCSHLHIIADLVEAPTDSASAEGSATSCPNSNEHLYHTRWMFHGPLHHVQHCQPLLPLRLGLAPAELLTGVNHTSFTAFTFSYPADTDVDHTLSLLKIGRVPGRHRGRNGGRGRMSGNRCWSR